MTTVFVFGSDIEAILREGKREIEISEGARISSAAQDLIKDNRVKVTYSAGRSIERGEELPGEKAPELKGPDNNEEQIDNDSIGSVEERSVQGRSGIEISEEELEEITRRVIARFRQIKGTEPTQPGESSAEDAADDDLIICRCEEITKGEIKDAIRNGMTTLNGVKRITRAGMGLCQGQTCQRLVTQILAGELGISPALVEPTTARAPVRPIRLSVFATA